MSELQAYSSTYCGWQTLCLSNEIASVQIAPTIGGRIIQYSLGDYEYLWVSPELAGTTPPACGTTPSGGFLNYGGEKIWPAPQAWDTGAYVDYCAFRGVNLDDKNPGPPMPDLDGAIHSGVICPGGIQLVGPVSKQFGIRLRRLVSLPAQSTCLHVMVEMENVDTRPHTWGIWAVAQLNAARRDRSLNQHFRSYIPVNPQSMFPTGYQIIFGQIGSPQFRPDYDRDLICVHFQDEVGKIGVDSCAGWCATVDGETGNVFVQRFPHFPHLPYPDNSSVEIWLNGKGTCYAYDQKFDMGDSPPHLIESEILGPLQEIDPGRSISFEYALCATNIGGDFPVIDCSPFGVVAEPISETRSAGTLRLSGRLGVFSEGFVSLGFTDDAGNTLGTISAQEYVSPASPLLLEESVLSQTNDVSSLTTRVSLRLSNLNGEYLGTLASMDSQSVIQPHQTTD